MEWVHCNYCFYQPSDNEKRCLYLTDCGHVYCKFCLKIDGNNISKNCPVCTKPYDITPINREMEEELQNYFTSPQNLMENVIKIHKFQNDHRLRFLQHIKQIKFVYERYKDILNKAQPKIKHLEKKMLQLENENLYLRTKCSPLIQVKEIQSPQIAKQKPASIFSPASSAPAYRNTPSTFGLPSSQVQKTPLSQKNIWTDRITLLSQRKNFPQASPKVVKLN